MMEESKIKQVKKKLFQFQQAIASKKRNIFASDDSELDFSLLVHREHLEFLE